jgi:hypothetical protein
MQRESLRFSRVFVTFFAVLALTSPFVKGGGRGIFLGPDRKAKIGVYRNGQWFLDLNGNGVWDGCIVDARSGSFGIAGDLPVAGSW